MGSEQPGANTLNFLNSKVQMLQQRELRMSNLLCHPAETVAFS